MSEVEELLSFKSVVLSIKDKNGIGAECLVSGDNDFIDQMDLQTILYNLMKNQKKSKRKIALQISLKNRICGFMYEDNAGGMSFDQISYFNQKEFNPYSRF